MKKTCGEWCIDINMEHLMVVALHALIHKPTPLTAAELGFIRSYLQMTKAAFSKTFGVSHVAVLKWESGKNRLSPALELCIRLYMFDHLHVKDKEFRALFREISLEKFSKSSGNKTIALVIDAADEDLKIAL